MALFVIVIIVNDTIMTGNIHYHPVLMLNILKTLIGLATRYCSKNGEWLTVNASSCQSRIFQEINATVCIIENYMCISIHVYNWVCVTYNTIFQFYTRYMYMVFL